jgi:hypothetical protein
MKSKKKKQKKRREGALIKIIKKIKTKRDKSRSCRPDPCT